MPLPDSVIETGLEFPLASRASGALLGDAEACRMCRTRDRTWFALPHPYLVG
ncbi:hypothetical protein ACFRQM_00775 [Streptomyces sp. NPDC056831]|uniref:hypothetical protein n=1 Tax=Streptomyces sp. NPDC056831 TaxID=3345954 RepID=UPI00367E60CC